jgi:hypothetical protein
VLKINQTALQLESKTAAAAGPMRLLVWGTSPQISTEELFSLL